MTLNQNLNRFDYHHTSHTLRIDLFFVFGLPLSPPPPSILVCFSPLIWKLWNAVLEQNPDGEYCHTPSNPPPFHEYCKRARCAIFWNHIFSSFYVTCSTTIVVVLAWESLPEKSKQTKDTRVEIFLWESFSKIRNWIIQIFGFLIQFVFWGFIFHLQWIYNVQKRITLLTIWTRVLHCIRYQDFLPAINQSSKPAP